jgi:hypothetical protein
MVYIWLRRHYIRVLYEYEKAKELSPNVWTFGRPEVRSRGDRTGSLEMRSGGDEMGSPEVAEAVGGGV